MISETIDRLLAGDALSAGDTEAAVGLVMRGEADPVHRRAREHLIRGGQCVVDARQGIGTMNHERMMRAASLRRLDRAASIEASAAW